MIQRLAERIVDWQVDRQALAAKDAALYRYAYEVLLNQMINILIAILIAVLWQAPMPVFVFLISYIPIRSFCGGYHAKTNGGCTIVSAMLICMVCLLTKVIQGNLVLLLQPAAFLISGWIVFRYAPVADTNKPLDEAEIVHYRKYSRRIWLAEVSAALLLSFCLKLPYAGLVIAISHIILSVMIVSVIYAKKPV